MPDPPTEPHAEATTPDPTPPWCATCRHPFAYHDVDELQGGQVVHNDGCGACGCALYVDPTEEP